MTTAPLSRWVAIGTFDSAADCTRGLNEIQHAWDQHDPFAGADFGGEPEAKQCPGPGDDSLLKRCEVLVKKNDT